MASPDTLSREMPALIEYATESAADASSLKSLREKIAGAIGERLPSCDWTGFLCWIPMTQRRSSKP